jgi:hypothetical protein
MLGEHNMLEKSVEDILIDLMAEKFMYAGIHASSIGGLKEYPSTGRRSGHVAKKRRKHHDDLANLK